MESDNEITDNLVNAQEKDIKELKFGATEKLCLINTLHTVISDIGTQIKKLNIENKYLKTNQNILENQQNQINLRIDKINNRLDSLQSFNGNENDSNSKRIAPNESNPKEEKTISKSTKGDSTKPLFNSSSGIYIPKNKNKEWF